MKNIRAIYFLGGILFTLFLCSFVYWFYSITPQPKKEKKSSLFASDSLISLSLSFDMDYFREVNEGKRFYHKALCELTKTDGKIVRMPAEVRLRGQFRVDTNYCDMPQLKVKLDKKFMGIKSFDLVLPCRNNPDYTQYLLQEYLLYKMYQRFCAYSYNTKLIKLNIQNQGKHKETYHVYAILQESDQDLEERFEAKEVETLPLDSHQINPLIQNKILVFQYVIGNDDWSINDMHNIKIFEKKNKELFPVPYDFDFAGIISTPYTSFDSTGFYTDNIPDKESPLHRFVLNEFAFFNKEFVSMIEKDTLLTPATKKRSMIYLKNTLDMLGRKRKDE